MPADKSVNASVHLDKIKLIRTDLANLEALAELRELEEKVAQVSHSNRTDLDIQTVSGNAGELAREVRQDIVQSSRHVPTAKRARSPAPDSGSSDKRRRYELHFVDVVHGHGRGATSSGTTGVQNHTTKAARKLGGLTPEDVVWLEVNVETYHGLGRREGNISWAHVLADRKELADRLTATQCATAWSQRQNRLGGVKEKQQQQPAELQPADIS